MEAAINILNLSVNDLEDNKIRRLMYDKANEYRQAIFQEISRLKSLSRCDDDYNEASILYGLLTPATDAALTVFWQQYMDPEDELKSEAAGVVLGTWKQYCCKASELIERLRTR